MGSPASIGVPRFELGTSPTRTERATRLRHTPSAGRVARPGISSAHAAGRPLRRRLHALSARAGARAGGISAAGRAARARRSIPTATRRRGSRRSTTLQRRARARARRRGLDRVHRADRARHGRRRGRRARVRDRRWCASGSGTRTSRSTRTRCPRSRSCGVTASRSGSSRTASATSTSSSRTTRSRSTRWSARRAHGRIKPHPSIFVAALRALGVTAEETAMVGDSYEDDIEGARALGMRAILLDRDGLRPDEPDRIDTLARAAGGARPSGVVGARLVSPSSYNPSSRRQASVCSPSSARRRAASADPSSAAASARVQTGPTHTSSPSKSSSHSASGRSRRPRRAPRRALPGPRRTARPRAPAGRGPRIAARRTSARARRR